MKNVLTFLFWFTLFAVVYAAGIATHREVERIARPIACLVQEWRYPGSRCDGGRAVEPKRLRLPEHWFDSVDG